MPISKTEGTISRKSLGPKLHHTMTVPEGAPRAALGLIHGYADHGARYAHVTDHLAQKGIACVTIDLRGHGRSEGPRGFCELFDEFLDDASELLRLVEERFPDAKRMLFGHSFGGLVSAESVLKRPGGWSALLLSAPFFALEMQVPGVKVAAAKVASSVYPKLALPSGLSGKDVTHDEARAKAYDEDPLVFKSATARWFTETRLAQAHALENAHKVELPLYMTFGEADKIASFAAGKRFFDRTGSKDKTWDPKKGLFHEVLNEPSWKEVADKMAEFVLAHA